MSDLLINNKHELEVSNLDFDIQLFASNDDDFFNSNKKTTAEYRELLAKAISSTGTIPKIVKMAFGDAGEEDSQGNPLPPKGAGPLNRVVLTKDIEQVTYPDSTSVCFQCTVNGGEAQAKINEVALIDENGDTAAKVRLFSSKAVDAETGLIFKWTVEF